MGWGGDIPHALPQKGGNALTCIHFHGLGTSVKPILALTQCEKTLYDRKYASEGSFSSMCDPMPYIALGSSKRYVSRNRQPRPLHGKRKPTTLSRAGNPFASARAVPPALQGIREKQHATQRRNRSVRWESAAKESGTHCVPK